MKRFNWWWLPLARHVAGWSAAGALIWAVPMFLLAASLVVGFGFWESSLPDDPRPRGGIPLSLMSGVATLGVIVSTVFLALGALTGAVAGFYAPTDDVRNPCRSRFFRAVSGQTFWFWLATSSVGVPTLAIAVYYGMIYTSRHQDGLLATGCALAFSPVFFALALWRAVNGASKFKAKSH